MGIRKIILKGRNISPIIKIKKKRCFECRKKLKNEDYVYSRPIRRYSATSYVKYYCKKCYNEIYEGVKRK